MNELDELKQIRSAVQLCRCLQNTLSQIDTSSMLAALDAKIERLEPTPKIKPERKLKIVQNNNR